MQSCHLNSFQNSTAFQSSYMVFKRSSLANLCYWMLKIHLQTPWCRLNKEHETAWQLNVCLNTVLKFWLHANYKLGCDSHNLFTPHENVCLVYADLSGNASIQTCRVKTRGGAWVFKLCTFLHIYLYTFTIYGPIPKTCLLISYLRSVFLLIYNASPCVAWDKSGK